MATRLISSSRFLIPKTTQYSLSFSSATTDLVTVAANSALELTGNYSVSGWFQILGVGGGSAGRIWNKNLDNMLVNSSFGIQVSNNNNNKVSGNNLLELRKWVFAVITYDGANIKFYKNGLQFGADVAQTTNPNGDSGLDFIIGNRVVGGSNRGYYGYMKDLRVYKARVLTLKEITNLYYGVEPTTTGLSGRWNFNEGSGTSATDSSGNSNTGTISGAIYSNNVPIQIRTSASGRLTSLPGKSMSFNGSSASINCGTANPGTVFTIGGWVRWDGTTDHVYKTIISKRTSYSNSAMTFVFVMVGATINASSNTTNANFSSYAVPATTWVHLAWVRSGTAANQNKLYVNGVYKSDASGALPDGTGTTAPIVIGGNQSPAQELFPGLLDEICICTSALNQTQIQDMMNRNYANVPNKWALWKFDDNAATATDSVGANTGTITAATYSSTVNFSSRSSV